MESTDASFCLAILSSANISLPKGFLGEAYDELGNRYIIPQFCLSDPSNLISSELATRSGAKSTDIASSLHPVSSLLSTERKSDGCSRKLGGCIKVTIRFSNNASDVCLSLEEDALLSDILQVPDVSMMLQGKKFLVFYMGRGPLSSALSLSSLLNASSASLDNIVLQIMVRDHSDL